MDRIGHTLMVGIVSDALKLDMGYLNGHECGILDLRYMRMKPEDLDEIFKSLHSMGCQPAVLNLRGNDLSELPPSVGLLGQLVCLNLLSNKLESLPVTMGNLMKLRTLLLGGNKLSTLPDSIASLPELLYLDLRYNDLEFLPVSFGRLYGRLVRSWS